MNTPELITDRLILRKFTEKDIEALYQILKDEEVNQFFALVSAEDNRRSRGL